MLTSGTCPDADLFRRLRAGDLPGSAREQLEDHLRQCDHCQRLAGDPGPGEGTSTDAAGHTLPTLEVRTSPAPSDEAPVAPSRAAPTQQHATSNATARVPATSLAALKPGDRLGHHEVLSVLGRGGMGVVFKARDTVLERTVAIKTLGPLLADNAVARKRFLREGRAAAAVKDPNVVTIYGVEGHDDGAPYIVLEYVEGQSLEGLLAKGAPLAADEVARLGAQIAAGLAAAHQKGLIHRDVKPANVLLEAETGRVVLTDFGLARALDDTSLSRSGEICGTPHYMAPEQVCGGAIDHRVDLFSLGSVLYYMATGELPFDAPTAVAVLHRVLDDRPRPLPPSVPGWLAQVITALHAKEPDQRIPTARQVQQALLTRGGWPLATHVLGAPAKPQGASPAPAPRRSRAVYAVLLGLVFLLSLPAFYFLTRGEASPAKGEREPERPAAEGKRPPAPAPAAEKAPEKKAEAAPSKPAPLKRREVAQPTPPRPAVTRPGGTPVVRKVPAAGTGTGAVVVRTTDTASADLFRQEGLPVRNRTTSEVVYLHQGRSYLPLGEYTWVQDSSPPGVRVSPRQFTVSADRSTYVTLTRLPPRSDGPAPSGAGPLPPDGPPPFPPPPPPRMPPRPGSR